MTGKKKFLMRINALLAIVSILLAGCHTQKKVASSETSTPSDTTATEISDPEIIALYGVPVRPMLKYGVPTPRPKLSTEQDDEAK